MSHLKAVLKSTNLRLVLEYTVIAGFTAKINKVMCTNNTIYDMWLCFFYLTTDQSDIETVIMASW